MSSSLAHRHLPAVAFMMVSVGLYATQDVLVKFLPEGVSLTEIIFFRSLFAFLPIALFYPFEMKKKVFRTTKPYAHLARSFFSTVALFFFIASFRIMPLADAYALTFSTPLFLALLALPLLKEKLSFQRVTAVIIGFGGVLIMLRPHGAFEWEGLIPLSGGFFYAVSLIQVRALSKEDSNTLIVFTFTLMSTVASFLLLLFTDPSLHWELLPRMLVIGFLGGSAQYAMTQAFRLAPVSSIAPFDYAAMIWAVVYGYLFWGDAPDLPLMLGASLVIVAGLALIRHERRLERLEASFTQTRD